MHNNNFLFRRSVPSVRYLLAGSAALITFFVYLPSLWHDFVDWDDNIYVFENASIGTFNFTFLRWAFTSFAASNWHPLTWISYGLDHAVWGLNPLGYHLTNIVLHSINTCIVFLLVVKLMTIAKELDMTGSLVSIDERSMLITGGVTGLLFGLHPLHVESVAWVSERKDLLCALFFMLSLFFYGKYSLSAAATGQQMRLQSRFSEKHYLWSLAFFGLALMSKPMAVSLPAVLLLLDWFPFNRLRAYRSALFAGIEKLPFIALSLVSSALTIMAQSKVLASTQNILPSERLLVAARSIITYLEKMLLPLDLLPFYQYPFPQEISLFRIEYALPVLLIAGCTFAAVISANRSKSWAVLWGYYVITLLPVLGIVQVGQQAMADRYTYLPSLAPFFIAGSFVARGWTEVSRSPRWQHASKAAFLASFLIIFAALTFLTVRQIGIWNNSFRLWHHTLAIKPDTYAAYNHLGLAYFRKGKFDEAIDNLKAAIKLNSILSEAYNNLGVVYFKQRRIAEAIEQYAIACNLNPGYAQAHLNLGLAYFEAGRIQDAIKAYHVAITLEPDLAIAFFNLGNAYVRLGSVDEAVAAYANATLIEPFYVDAHYNLGTLYSNKGLYDQALSEFQIVLRIDPDNSDIHNNLGVVYAEQGRYAEAIQAYENALRIDPANARAYNNLGNAYLNDGRQEEAIVSYTEALKIDPRFADAHFNRASLYAQQGRKHDAIEGYKAALALNPYFNEARDGLLRIGGDK